MSIQPTRIVSAPQEGHEVHMMGSYVGVCWSYRRNLMEPLENPFIKNYEWIKSDSCYIDFVYIREGRNGIPYVDEDSSVAGGIGTKESIQIMEELKLAVEYIKENNFTECA